MKFDIRKEAIRITNQDGFSLYGIITRPDKANNRKRLVISCQSGVVAKTEIGDHLRWVADRLAEQGITVLRFDQHGTGDSQGECEQDISVRLFFQKVQNGCFTNDTLSVIDWAVQHFADYDIFLLGECGGCISALAAGAERLEKIKGYILIAPPVLRFADTNSEKQISTFDTKITRKQYYQKIFNPVSWIRFVCGKSDFKLIFSSFIGQLVFWRRKLFSKFLSFSIVIPDHPNFNMLFWKSFMVIAEAKKTICFLLPELDNETFEFNVEFKQKILDRHKKQYITCESVLLPETDHSIMFPQARRLAVNAIINLINRTKTAGNR